MPDNQLSDIFTTIESCLHQVNGLNSMIDEALEDNKEFLETQGFTKASFKSFVKSVMDEKLQEVINKGELFKIAYNKIK